MQLSFQMKHEVSKMVACAINLFAALLRPLLIVLITQRVKKAENFQIAMKIYSLSDASEQLILKKKRSRRGTEQSCWNALLIID